MRLDLLLGFAAASASLLVSAAASANGDDVRFSLGAGAALVAPTAAPYDGDVPKISDALGARTTTSHDLRIAPVLTETIWFGEFVPREWTFGIEASQRWWSRSTEMRSPETAKANFRVDRDLLIVDALFVATRTSTGIARFTIGAGPAVHRIRTRESGWLGDADVVDLRVGGRALISNRFALSETFGLAIDTSVTAFEVPRTNPLTRDGGVSFAFELGLRVDAQL
jgi:hypothetical protein